MADPEQPETPPAEQRVPVLIPDPGGGPGQVGTVALSEYQANRGVYKPLSREEWKRAKYVNSMTDEPLEKAGAAALGVVASGSMSLSDLAAAKMLTPEQFEDYRAIRQSKYSQTAEGITDVGTAVAGGLAAIGKAGVKEVAKPAIKEAVKAETKQALKTEGKALVKEGLGEVVETGVEAETKQAAKTATRELTQAEADDALLAIAQETGNSPLGKALSQGIIAKTAGGLQKVAQYSPTGLGVQAGVKAGQAAEKLVAKAGGGEILQKGVGLGVEGASEAALYQVKQNISEASLGKEELTAERLFAGVPEVAGGGFLFGGVLGAGTGAMDKLLRKGLKKGQHLVPEAKSLDDAINRGALPDELAELSAQQSGHSAKDIKRLFDDPAIRADHRIQNELKKELSERFRKAWDNMHEVDSVDRMLMAGELKADNVAKTVKRDPATMRAAARRMDDATSGLLHENEFIQEASRAAFSKKEYDALREMASSARSRMKSALRNGDEAEAYLALEDLKRDLDNKAKSAKTIKPKNTTHREQLAALHKYAKEEANGVRQFLEDEEVWGLAGRNQKLRNAAATEMIGPSGDMHARFSKELREGAEGTVFDPNEYGTRKIKYADPSKIESYLSTLTESGQEVVHNQTSRYFDAREKWLKTMLDSGELPPELVSDFKKALQATQTGRATINEASTRMSNVNMMNGLLTEEAQRAQMQLGLIPTVGLGFATGGVRGAAAAGADRVMGYALSRPAGIARQLAVVESMGQRAKMVDAKIGSSVKRYVKAAIEASKRGAVKTGAAVNRAGRVAVVAAPPAYIALHGKNKEERRKSVEKRMERVMELAQDPVLSLKHAGAITRGMGDSAPSVTAAAVAKHQAAIDHIASKAKPSVLKSPSALQPHLTKSEYSDQQIDELAKALTIVEKPLSILDDLESGNITTAQVETMKLVWPELYQDIRQKTMRELANTKNPLPFSSVVQLSILLDLPGHPTLSPGFLQRQAERHQMRAEEQGQGPSQQGGAPAPSGKMPEVVGQSQTLAEQITASL